MERIIRFQLPRLSLIILAWAAIFLLGFEQIALACPTCQDAVAQNDPTSAGLVSGFFWSILFMLSMPFLILAGLSTYFYVLVLQARKQQAQSAQAGQRELVETR